MNEMLKAVLDDEEIVKFDKSSLWARGKIQSLANSLYFLSNILNQDNKPTLISIKDHQDHVRYLDDHARLRIEVSNGRLELILQDGVLKIYSLGSDGVAVIPQAHNCINVYVAARNPEKTGAQYFVGEKKI